jgi:penicillin-binding protein 1C
LWRAEFVRRAGFRRAAVLAAGVVATALWIRLGPLPPGLLDVDSAPSIEVVDRHGERLYEVRSALGTRGDRLDPVALPPLLVRATLAAEDTRFYSHAGVDPRAVARAAWRNLRAGRVVEGGSTISQQVAKLLIARQRGSQAEGWRAKFHEAVIALRLEHRLTKDEILALYLSLAPYGNQIEGASRAARAYFGRGVQTMTPAEAAFLAALPQQPGRFNPWRDGSAARSRQRRILAVMAARGWLTAAELAAARDERLSLVREDAAAIAPHFVEQVVMAVARQSPARPTTVIETTLDARLQRIVQGVIAANRQALARHHARNVAVAVLDNRTSEWIAWEGSGNYFDVDHGGAIDGVTAPRQPGSALKPFTYAAAFERGFHPAHVLADVPSQFPTAEPGILYSPRNYDGRYRGPLRVRAALAGSENVPAVALAAEIGVPALARLLRQTGITTLDRTASHYGLGLTLGNAEVRLDELVAAYATFARGGVYASPTSVRAIDGRREPAAAEARVLSERAAFWVADILADADARAYVFGRGGSLEFPFSVAAKTGTSQAFHDNWAVGFTRDVTVGVWVGNFDRTPLRFSSGVTGAGPVFHDVMLAAVEYAAGTLPLGDSSPVLRPPADVARRDVCVVSGMAPHEGCRTTTMEWLPADSAQERCTWHHVHDGEVMTIWPDAYRQWARAEGLLDSRPAIASFPDAPDRASVRTGAKLNESSPLAITAPLAGALYLIDPTLRSEFQRLPLRAAGGSPGPVEWFVDDAPVGRAGRDEPMWWPLAKGRHEIAVRDASGRTATTHVVVR